MALLLGLSIMLALLAELILAPALLRRFGPALLGKRAKPAPDTLAPDSP